MRFLMLSPVLLLVAGGMVTSALRTFQLKVKDEDGNPKPGVEAHIKFAQSKFSGELDRGSVYKRSDAAGLITAKGNADLVSYIIEEKGYYPCKGVFSMEGKANEHETTLKTIDNPKTMYAKNIEATIPSEGKTYSYDLKVGDWLPPLGHGVTPDFNFKGGTRWNSLSNYDQSLQLSFSNPDDGIVAISVHEDGSSLRLPKNAPVSGYLPTWTWRDADSSKQSLGSQERTIANRAFFFRVRSSRDNGGAVKAWYGKISHDIGFSFGAKREGLYLKIYGYYLNPDNTTALEFDTNKNLLALKWPEAVTEP